MFKEDALRLYKIAFPDDSDDFAEGFINKFFDKSCHYLTDNGRLVSMLFAFDATITANGKKLQAYYVYAVATLPEYRGQGMIRRLMSSLEEKGLPLVIKPSSRELFAFYEKLGFKTAFYNDIYLCERLGVSTPEPWEVDPYEYYEKREALLKDTPHVTLDGIKEFSLGDMRLLAGKGLCCAYDPESNTAYEFLSDGKEGEQAVLNYLGAESVLFRGISPKEPFAMLLSSEELPNKMYMGLAIE